MSLELQLDAMYGSFLDKRATPLKFECRDVATFFKEKDDAFALKDPGTARPICLIGTEDTSDGCVVRMCIGYRHISTIKDDYFTGIFILSLLKNEMLAQAAIHFNLETCKTVTFTRPGGPKTYFSQIADRAGMELILVVQK